MLSIVSKELGNEEHCILPHCCAMNISEMCSGAQHEIAGNGSMSELSRASASPRGQDTIYLTSILSDLYDGLTLSSKMMFCPGCSVSSATRIARVSRGDVQYR